MAKKRKDNRWNDIDGGAAFVIPYTLLRHPNFTRLSAFGNKLIMDLARQYSGFNNGYLCTAWALMKQAGWRSEDTVRNAMQELEHYRLIERTQQGGRNRPNLHALTWRRIDEKKDLPLDVSPTMKPSDAWKVEQIPFMRTMGIRKARKPKSARRKKAP
ncbi:hypothetical protein [Luteimonas sp. R10]|uniref:hypothetical protein n=1 Tax=Luteimonas sp. R10 TaxID=3108176 RepID=UPI00308B6CD2|nr:hypothetical protein U3649_14465 [Luteimonas sp. R10]